jgi:hypothetical protein
MAARGLPIWAGVVIVARAAELARMSAPGATLAVSAGMVSLIAKLL